MKLAIAGVFFIVWVSLAFFWHTRDWNTASRLMLTYSLVDRGSIKIDGLDDQTGDKAFFNGHFYTDKLPGYSFLAAIIYAPMKFVLQLPPHPVGVAGFAYWQSDYAVTIATSGLATAAIAAMIVWLAGRLGCSPRSAAILGLAYGLGTPAFVYGQLAYGHQVASACLLGSFALIWTQGTSRIHLTNGLAGFLAAFASVVELQVGPVSAILGLYVIALVLRKARPASTVLAFALGAAIPTIFLGIYNVIAFDSPLKMGYFFHATDRFREVHSAENPLGLKRPDWSRLLDLTLKPARGLFWYAPICLLTVPGIVALMIKRRFDVAIITTSTIVAVFLVNLSYPEWSGGWSTGPRLLVPMLPFAVLPIAALLSSSKRSVIALTATLGILGAVIMLLFAGVGGRIPDPQPVSPGIVDRLSSPLFDAVLPMWSGELLPPWTFGQRFSRTITSLLAPGWVASLPRGRQWLQFVPLAAFQLVAVTILMLLLNVKNFTRPTNLASQPAPTETPPPAKPDRG